MTYSEDIDLVLPCYNPHPGWEQKVIQKFQELQQAYAPLRFHLFIVSDGSHRGYEPETVQALRTAITDCTIVDYRPNRGKGYALREAVKHGTSPYTIYTDYDFPYTDTSFRDVVNTLLSGADVVVAIRDSNYQDSLPRFRQFLSKSSHLCNIWLLRMKVHDTQGGLKGFSRVGRAVFLSTQINSFLFDTEFIYKAEQQKLRIQTVNTRIREGIAISDMGLKVLKREVCNFLSILFNK